MEDASISTTNMHHLRPQLEVGEKVVAAWWDNDERTGKSQWFPGEIMSYRTVDSNSRYGHMRMYDVEFEDGDTLSDLEDCWVFSKDDYQLMDRKKIGVKNVVDKDCDDDWARIVGWYVADIGDEKRSFSRLVDAMKAYDEHAVHINGEKNPSRLNMPENYPNLLKEPDAKPAKKRRHHGGRVGKSSYRGVHWQKNRKKWMSRYSLAHKGEKHINLGAFADEKQAALAWDVEARRQGRPDSDLNFPGEKATEAEIISWKGNKYKTMTKNGKLGKSKYRGVSMINDRMYTVKCNINAVKIGLGLADRIPQFGVYNNEIQAAHVFDYVCREFGVAEHELNFPLNEGAVSTILAEAGKEEALDVIESIRLGGKCQRIGKRGTRLVRKRPCGKRFYEDEVVDDEDELFEVEAFVAKPSPETIEVKWVGTYTRTIKEENELRGELEPIHYARFEGLLDRWSACSMQDYCAVSSIEHDDHCMVCDDGGELICCETCPCVVHPCCVQLSNTSHRWRCAICRRQAPNLRVNEPVIADMADESDNNASNEADEEDEYCTSTDDCDTDSEFDQDDYYSSGEEEFERDDCKCATDAISVEERYRKQSRIAKAALRRTGNKNGAVSVEKLTADGTVISEFPSKREAVSSLGLGLRNNGRFVQLKDASCCIEYRGFFWRLKGSSALPNFHTARHLKSCRPVEKLCVKTGQMIKRYNSVADAARDVGISAPSISNICNGWKGHLTAGGYCWRFSSNLNQERDDAVEAVNRKPVERTKEAHVWNRRPVEQVDSRTGQVIATFKSKTAAYAAFNEGGPKTQNIFSKPDFEDLGVHAFGFFWRPTGSKIAPPMKSQTKKRGPKREKMKRTNVQLYGEEVVGQSVEVYRKKKWKEGIVESFDASRKSHIIRYEHDGAKDELILADQKLRWNKWKKTHFGSLEEECPICFEDRMVEPAATVCGHIFCKECISSVIETRHCCPMCMYSLEGNKAKLTMKGTTTEDIPDVFRAVEQVCMKNGEVLRVFSSAAAASALIGGDKGKRSTPSVIIRVCQGVRGAPRSAAGFSWRFHGSNDKTQLIGDRAIDGKAVECVDVETGDIVNTYESVRSAAKETGFSRPVISQICKRTRREPFYKGFFWRYKGDESKPWSPRKPPGLPIEQISLLSGEVLAKFPSAAKAMEALVKNGEVAAQKWKNYVEKGHGITSDIGSVCRLERRSAYGYFWRYQGSNNKPEDFQEKERGKKVRRISITTEKVLQEYSTAVDAFNDFEDVEGFTYSSLCRACREGAEYHGYFWEYV